MCEPKDNLVEAEAIMQEARVRRLPVVDKSEHLLGVLSLADLAREAGREFGARKQGITKAEIGKVLSVTESRVCQIHTKAVMSLRNRLMEPPTKRV